MRRPERRSSCLTCWQRPRTMRASASCPTGCTSGGAPESPGQRHHVIALSSSRAPELEGIGTSPSAEGAKTSQGRAQETRSVPNIAPRAHEFPGAAPARDARTIGYRDGRWSGHQAPPWGVAISFPLRPRPFFPTFPTVHEVPRWPLNAP
jgi:hypothetical protein